MLTGYHTVQLHFHQHHNLEIVHRINLQLVEGWEQFYLLTFVIMWVCVFPVKLGYLQAVRFELTQDACFHSFRLETRPLMSCSSFSKSYRYENVVLHLGGILEYLVDWLIDQMINMQWVQCSAFQFLHCVFKDLSRIELGEQWTNSQCSIFTGFIHAL